MGLEQAIAKKKAADQKTGINHHPEIDAKIDKFIAENPETYQKIKAYTHEELVRKRMLDMADENERRQGYSSEMRQHVEQNPEIKKEVERRLNKMPEDQRARAYTRVAQGVIAQHSMRQNQGAAPAYSGPALKP